MISRIPRERPECKTFGQWMSSLPTHWQADVELQRIVESAPKEWRAPIRARYERAHCVMPSGIEPMTVGHYQWLQTQPQDTDGAWDRLQALADYEDQYGDALRWNLEDYEIRDWAQRLANDVCEFDGIARKMGASLAKRVDMIRNIARAIGIQEDKPIQGEPAIKRALDPKWWRLRLRKHVARVVEAGFITMGLVHQDNGGYISSCGLQRRKQQLSRNAEALATTLFTNEAGQVYNLGELAALGISNPLVRGGELMTRIRGAEQYADHRAHVGLFVTLTLPSRFHPVKLGKGRRPIPNDKYAGATPRDGQQWLRKCWQRVRAKLGRLGVQMYGLRVAEPHHDATPHWHALLWVENEEQAQQLEATIRQYWLQDDGDEPGAQKNRVCIKRMIAGGAAGYVAKYIAKSVGHHALAEHMDVVNGENITMEMFERDFRAEQEAEAKHAKQQQTSNGHRRVDAWASTWGIRQFQTVGMPSVTVWRELRRVTGDQLELFEREGDTTTARAARACHRHGEVKADWCAFMESMGGHARRRNEWHLAPVRRQVERGQTNKYGEALPCGRLIGLVPQRGRMCGRYLVSRRIAWKPYVETIAAGAAKAAGSAEIANEEGQAQGAGAAASRQALPAAWTRFNNCTARLDVYQHEDLIGQKLGELGTLKAAIEAVEFETGAWI